MKFLTKVFFIALSICAICHSTTAQKLSSSFHTGRREAVRELLHDSAVAIFFSAPIRNRSNDVDFDFHQDPDFYYLTGFPQPDAVLLVFKEFQTINGRRVNELLFIHNRDPKKEQWLGSMMTVETASTSSGIHVVYYSSSFDTLHLNFNSLSLLMVKKQYGLVNNKSDTLDLYDLNRMIREKFGLKDSLENGGLKRIMAGLREVKLPEELSLLRKAISISSSAHNEMMRYTQPGLSEYHTQAVGEYIFKRDGAESIGYSSICGAGKNGCILHYTMNRSPLLKNELLLLDMGAEYLGYTADLTRTIPVTGQFTPEQKTIYQLVYDAQEAAFRMCAPGNAFKDPHNAAVKVIKEGLLHLGIIQKEEEYIIYFPHGTSHYLGLDVHDAGTKNELKPGNVITIEPGIYIPEGSKCDPKWWNIGIRIEDDVLILIDGFENLSKDCPRKIPEIEALMKEKSFLNK